jgi:uncharacterized Fe-S cluster-containing protein
MSPVKTPVLAIQERCISALYDADSLGGVRGEDLIPRLSLTANEKRAWAVLLDLCEAERVIQDSPANGSRFRLSAAEMDAEFSRRFAKYRPKEKFAGEWRNV